MKITCGVDSIEISRIKKSVENIRFIERIYGEEELNELKRRGMPVQSLAATFCAKEAFSKSVGLGFSGVTPSEVQVLHDENGKPYFHLTGDAKTDFKDIDFELSITHTDSTATAFVIACRRTEK